MCGRFTLASPPELVAELFDIAADDLPLFDARYNIAPTQPVIAARLGESGERECVELRWGLVPSWAKDASGAARLINARSETAAEKPSFRAAMKRRRCLVAADGYYEWRQEGKSKQPYYFQLQSEKPFALAGLWERWRDPQGMTLETCSLLTTDANALVGKVHDRMPVIVDRCAFDVWLDAEEHPVEDVLPLLAPYDPDAMTFTAVNPYVNNARHQGRECIEPLPTQQDLF